ncbi:tRNA (adenosine(37)-N6)-threonylcarbamoyltransferase complex ATPase subunit type 1 TsaE [Hydrogeniiclostridium mannosilyticum]|uniref:tRNA threonylcarbamoyladenosine biosynthesis protein TsaE n=1 Tax=Hydrogeniiclostridium mannosilyticum TaxID=2764322 RepID=A0A328UKF4_9FIRM|nr:tRNA (adenosine(37)-N6)-threonylcarbamoyltransferase complex ATPase subunit type 1 TsaE [Hydrogeniiclostridium mannosilyticum]RAQ30444.1 tRNA (adenosine(37)-N6)-threonylcarbamoyltransferase complex ATPase subunit type 1 TsaE [Hydrogeniiclostridium mannosilyticum]
MKMTTTSPRETELLGEHLARQLKGGEVLALFGGMGMGKTAFTRGLARGLDVQEPVSSPTFALVNEYAGRLPLYHFDMYRVTSWDDLYSTGFFDYLETGGVLVIEWSENIEEALPENTVKIIFKRGNGENDREIEIEGLEL